jgi:hypothetical protein
MVCGNQSATNGLVAELFVGRQPGADFHAVVPLHAVVTPLSFKAYRD